MPGHDDRLPQNADEFRWWMRQKIEEIEHDTSAAHVRLERTLVEILARLVPLEQLRAMVIGAVLVLGIVAPLVWWLLTQIASVTTKGGP